MAQSFRIRALKPADGKDLIRNYYGYHEELRRNPELGIHLSKRPTFKDELKWFRVLRQGVRDGTKIVSVAEVGGRVVGMCDVGVGKGVQSHMGTLGIAIVEKERGKGIGKALIKDVIGKCKGKVEIIKLAVFASNNGAKRLYRRLGFKKYGTLKDAVKRGKTYFDEELMYLDLRR